MGVCLAPLAFFSLALGRPVLTSLELGSLVDFFELIVRGSRSTVEMGPNFRVGVVLKNQIQM